jgi:hypothetical protein
LSAAPPRYGRLPLPPYRFLPGRSPHPRRDPGGHSFGQPEVPHAAWDPEAWRSLEPWLHGIDLYNARYFWECHEALEPLWIAGGRTTPHARFVRGVILVAAACLNRELEKAGAGRRQAALGIRHLESVPASRPVYMGLRVAPFTAGVAACFGGGAEPPVAILEA